MSTVTELDPVARRRADLREILAELAAAGWTHTLQVSRPPEPGVLPEHIHRWDRDGAYIEVVYDRYGPVDYLRYEPTPDEDFSGVLIGVQWAAATSLTKLYVHADQEHIFDRSADVQELSAA